MFEGACGERPAGGGLGRRSACRRDCRLPPSFSWMSWDACTSGVPHHCCRCSEHCSLTWAFMVPGKQMAYQSEVSHTYTRLCGLGWWMACYFVWGLRFLPPAVSDAIPSE